MSSSKPKRRLTTDKELLAVRTPTHVMPTYGREHESSVDCWCKPYKDHVEPSLYIHRDPN